MSLLKSLRLDFWTITLEGLVVEGWVVESCPLDGEGSERNADITMKITEIRRVI